MKENTYTGYGAVIKEYRIKAGMSRAELADILQLSRNTLVNWEIERCQPDLSSTRALCELLHIPISELMQFPDAGGTTAAERAILHIFRELSPTGQKLAKKSMLAIRDVEQDEREQMLLERGMFLPAQVSALAAGTGNPFVDAPPEIQFVFRNSVNAKADTIVPISGRSMEPYYNDGDRVYVRYTDACDPGDIVACSTADGGVIKRVNDSRQLVSLNPNYPFGMKNEDDNVTVLGRVLGIVQPEDIPDDADIPLLEELFSKELREFRMENGLE